MSYIQDNSTQLGTFTPPILKNNTYSNNYVYYNNVLSKPTNFQADWNSTIINKPDLSIYATTASLSSYATTTSLNNTSNFLVNYNNLINTPNLNNYATTAILTSYATTISLNNTSNWLYQSNINTYNACINYNNLINKPTILTNIDTSNISSNVFNYLITGSSNQIFTNSYLASSNYIYNTSNILINYNNHINKPTILTTTDTSNISSNVFNYLITGSSNQIYTNAYLASSNYTYNVSNICINYNNLINKPTNSSSSYWNLNGTNIYNNNSGFVGIGTNNPTQKLDILGGSIVIRSLNENINSTLYLCTPFGNSTAAYKSAIIAEGLSSWSRSKLHFCLNNGTSDNVTASITDARLSIIPSGNVGINNINPNYTLDVGGDINYTGILRLNGVNALSNVSNICINYNNLINKPTITGSQWGTGASSTIYYLGNVAIQQSTNATNSVFDVNGNSRVLGNINVLDSSSIAPIAILTKNINVCAPSATIRIWGWNTTYSPTIELISRNGLPTTDTDATYYWNVSIGSTANTFKIRDVKNSIDRLTIEGTLNYTSLSGSLLLSGDIVNTYWRLRNDTDGWCRLYNNANSGYFPFACGNSYVSGNQTVTGSINNFTIGNDLYGTNWVMNGWKMWCFGTGFGNVIALCSPVDYRYCFPQQSGYSLQNMSDERIKSNIKKVKTDYALQKILLLEPIEYNHHKDKDKDLRIGLKAQDVKKELKDLVNDINKEFQANILSYGRIDNKIIKLDKKISSIIKPNDTIKINLDNPDGKEINMNTNDNKYKKRFAKVKEIIDDYTFEITDDLDENKVIENIFVFGTLANDIHTIDYNSIFTLNLCATQELYKIIQQQQDIINQLKKDVEELKMKIN